MLPQWSATFANQPGLAQCGPSELARRPGLDTRSALGRPPGAACPPLARGVDDRRSRLQQLREQERRLRDAIGRVMTVSHTTRRRADEREALFQGATVRAMPAAPHAAASGDVQPLTPQRTRAPPRKVRRPCYCRDVRRRGRPQERAWALWAPWSGSVRRS